MACPDPDVPPPYPLPSGCGGSSSPTDDPCCGAQLAAFPDLTLTVPDGGATGTYTMNYDAGSGTWITNGVVPGHGKIVMACQGGHMAIYRITDPGTTYAATAFDCGPPILFTFPGTPVGSSGDATIGV